MVFRMTERTAATPKRCVFCTGPIEVGARYIDGFWMPNGEPEPWVAHVDCQDLANTYPYADEGVPPFADWYVDDWGDDATKAELLRLHQRAQKANDISI